MTAVSWGGLLRGTASLPCDQCCAKRTVLGFRWANSGPLDTVEKGFITANDYKFWYAVPGQLTLRCGHPVTEVRIEY